MSIEQTSPDESTLLDLISFWFFVLVDLPERGTTSHRRADWNFPVSVTVKTIAEKTELNIASSVDAFKKRG